MSLAQGFPNTFSATQQTQEVLKNTDNETKKIYTDINALMAVGGHAHTGNGSDGGILNFFSNSGGTLTGVLNEALGAPIASASTINLTTATGNFLHVTGTTTITAVTLGAGMRREIIFDGILTLTHHATNNNLPSGANITTAVGDRASYYSDGTTVYCTKYQKADGKAVSATEVTIASSAEAIAGTDNVKMVTPLRIRDAFNCTGAAPIYACRAWVNFNGTGTVVIRASGNVSSITDVGTGVYDINFAAPMPDINFVVLACATDDTVSSTGVSENSVFGTTRTVSKVRITVSDRTVSAVDRTGCSVSIFR